MTSGSIPRPPSSSCRSIRATTDLVAYYKFDGDANDSAGAHTGPPRLPGCVAGKVGQAINFLADSQYVTVAYATDLGMNSYTVAAWVNVTDKSGRGVIGTRFSGDNTFDLKAEATRIQRTSAAAPPG